MESTKPTQVPSQWDASRLPDLHGKTAIVTGANSGIGYVTALELARKGAHVVLACRNKARGTTAMTQMQQELGEENAADRLEFMQLDTSSLQSVQAFATQFKSTHQQLHLLINNAGIMAVPHALTVDGFESQFATNHLGHFALTCQLMDLLIHSAPSRIVNVSSNAHQMAMWKSEEIMTPATNYNPSIVYANSKLANLLFTMELNRRLQAKHPNVVAVACHPGSTATNLITSPATEGTWYWRVMWKIASFLPIFQTAAMGALPTLYAAAGEPIAGGDYIGPNGLASMWGYPTLEQPKNKSHTLDAAQKLWKYSEELTKLSFDIQDAAT